MRVFGYVRVSTDKQSDAGFSLDAQKAKLEAYASLYDLQVVDLVVETGSAKDLSRPGLQALIRRLQAGEAQGLVVCKLDRLTRSVADLGRLVEGVFQKVALLSVAEQIDTRSAAGRLVLNVLASVSQWEREAIGERTKSVMQYMKAQGEYTGGEPPYGFRLEDGRLVEQPAEQALIALVKRYRAEGMTLRAISSVLAEQGRVSRTGRPFHAQTVARLAA